VWRGVLEEGKGIDTLQGATNSKLRDMWDKTCINDAEERELLLRYASLQAKKGGKRRREKGHSEWKLQSRNNQTEKQSTVFKARRGGKRMAPYAHEDKRAVRRGNRGRRKKRIYFRKKRG